MKYYHRKDCRLCGSNDLALSLEFTATPPADSYVQAEEVGADQECIPLDLYCCNECGHTQLGSVIDAEQVYLNYIYETASTLGLDSHFRASAQAVMMDYKPDSGGLVVDIGSNDGCLLNCFKELSMNVLGIDPMPGIAEKATELGVETLPEFFTEGLARQIRSDYGVANIVTSNNLVADTDDLTSFIENVKLLMNKDSIFFFETFSKAWEDGFWIPGSGLWILDGLWVLDYGLWVLDYRFRILQVFSTSKSHLRDQRL